MLNVVQFFHVQGFFTHDIPMENIQIQLLVHVMNHSTPLFEKIWGSCIIFWLVLLIWLLSFFGSANAVPMQSPVIRRPAVRPSVPLSLCPSVPPSLRPSVCKLWLHKSLQLKLEGSYLDCRHLGEMALTHIQIKSQWPTLWIL